MEYFAGIISSLATKDFPKHPPDGTVQLFFIAIAFPFVSKKLWLVFDDAILENPCSGM
jgi:hypothetical protein